MPRTPLASTLHQLTGGLPRRAFLRTLPAAAMVPTRSFGSSGPKIAIIGGGLAGLTCAYRLKQAGLSPDVYEASTRAGGRCWTRRGDFDAAQIAEHGGELIDQGHAAIRHLAQSLGLKLDNLLAAEKNGTEPLYHFDGEPYAIEDATRDLKKAWKKIHSDLSAASYPTLYNNFTQRGWELDHLSIRDWIEESIPGGIASKLGQLLDVAYNIEYGAETPEQSSLNLIYLLGYRGPGNIRLFGPSNEKYHVRGGNDQIPARLAAAVNVHYGRELTSINAVTNAKLTLTFASGSDVLADFVVLALPFSILRASVDYSQAGFRSLKQTAIAEQGVGSNTKLNVQFTDRHWESLGANGDSFSDLGYQATWDVTRDQPGTPGILVNYTGGLVSDSFSAGTPAQRAAQFLTQIEPAMPGLGAKFNGKATLDHWPAIPFARGSYSFWKVGQYTKFAGIEREPEGRVHFAGEHTSVDFQGYLNGAVESGDRAASEILAALK